MKKIKRITELLVLITFAAGLACNDNQPQATVETQPNNPAPAGARNEAVVPTGSPIVAPLPPVATQTPEIRPSPAIPPAPTATTVITTTTAAPAPLNRTERTVTTATQTATTDIQAPARETTPTSAMAAVPLAPADFTRKTNKTADFNGQFTVRALSFEARDLVINLKVTVDCKNEVKGNRYAMFVHVVKNGEALIGMGPLDLVTEGRQLKTGEKLELNFLTQLSQKFDPKSVDGIRFGILQLSDAGEGRLPIIASDFELQDTKSAAFWNLE